MKSEKKTLVPRLRFPEFRESGSWKKRLLGDLFINRQERGYAQLPLLSVTSEDGVIPQQSTNRKKSASADKTRYLRIVPGDIVYNTMRMWQGRSAYVTQEGIVSPAYTVCKPKNDVNGLFYSYYFKNSELIIEFWRYSQGIVSDTLNLKFSAFSEISVVCPQPGEQQKIADCLSSLDALIAAQADKIDALKAHKKGLMQQLFPREGETVPHLRFPEFRDAGEWTTKPLGKILSIGNGKDHKHLPDGDVPVYGSGGYMRSVNDYLYDGESVCIGRKGTIDKPVLLSGKFWTVDTLFYTHSFRNAIPRFIFALFQNIKWLKHNEAGGVPSLSKTNIVKIEVAIPEVKEQQKIADCLSFLDALIAAQADKIDALKTHKKGLMQQLFPSPEAVRA